MCLDDQRDRERPLGADSQRGGRVRNWQSGTMALRWSSCALEAASKQFRKVMGHQQLWMLKAHLDELAKEEKLEQMKRAG